MAGKRADGEAAGFETDKGTSVDLSSNQRGLMSLLLMNPKDLSTVTSTPEQFLRRRKTISKQTARHLFCRFVV